MTALSALLSLIEAASVWKSVSVQVALAGEVLVLSLRDCDHHSDFSGIKVSVKCSKLEKLATAITTEEDGSLRLIFHWKLQHIQTTVMQDSEVLSKCLFQEETSWTLRLSKYKKITTLTLSQSL
ncbi:hypothetical protein HAX54_026405 [Datura stramonium]|uniref:Uncharacterized protein n=1 Tax=Datura stramonium TaxID=4076 RepID=A0ABS8S793_DATST|nr:hypothetical protein [Datura stramonium]